MAIRVLGIVVVEILLILLNVVCTLSISRSYKMKTILQEVLDNAGASAEDKKAATAQANAIAENVLQESKIENLILAKGFADSVVHIEGDACSVVVQSVDLQPQESLQIMEIVVSQTGVAADKVQILSVEA